MTRKNLRDLLHVIAVVCWVVGLVADLRDHRWKAFGAALASHIVAEMIGGYS